MLEFHIPITYVEARFININIYCEFLKKCGNNMLKAMNKKKQKRIYT